MKPMEMATAYSAGDELDAYFVALEDGAARLSLSGGAQLDASDEAIGAAMAAGLPLEGKYEKEVNGYQYNSVLTATCRLHGRYRVVCISCRGARSSRFPLRRRCGGPLSESADRNWRRYPNRGYGAHRYKHGQTAGSV